MFTTSFLKSIEKIEQKYGIPHNEQPSLYYIKSLIMIDNYDSKDDSQRKMCWFALIGMLIYPILILISDYIGLDHASNLISDISGIYFASVSAIVAIFFGANAYAKGKDYETRLEFEHEQNKDTIKHNT